LRTRRLLPILVVIFLILAVPEVSRTASDQSGPSPDDALQQLLDGNAHYVQDRAERPAQRPSAAAQHPLAVIVSCSDSRVPPEIIFDRGVGSLFVVRAAGNTCDRLGIQSIEYAVSHLGTRLVLVLGHDSCGAVTAAVKSYPKAGTGPMLENIYPAVRETQHRPGDAVANAIDENAILVARRLAEDPAFSASVTRGALKIVPARYALATGKVQILSAQ